METYPSEVFRVVFFGANTIQRERENAHSVATIDGSFASREGEGGR